jgi:hypothetical protein
VVVDAVVVVDEVVVDTALVVDEVVVCTVVVVALVLDGVVDEVIDLVVVLDASNWQLPLTQFFPPVHCTRIS